MFPVAVVVMGVSGSNGGGGGGSSGNVSSGVHGSDLYESSKCVHLLSKFPHIVHLSGTSALNNTYRNC